MTDGIFYQFEQQRKSKEAIQVSEAFQKEKIENPGQLGKQPEVDKNDFSQLIQEELRKADGR